MEFGSPDKHKGSKPSGDAFFLLIYESFDEARPSLPVVHAHASCRKIDPPASSSIEGVHPPKATHVATVQEQHARVWANVELSGG